MKEIRVKNYTIKLAPIGQGAYSRVYKGYDHINKKSVAIKIMTDPLKAAKEAKVMRAYQESDYLPHYYNFFIEKNRAYLVMEHINGRVLGGDYYYRGKKHDQKFSLEVVINTLRGLQQLHNSGYVHWDVKPKNTMIIAGSPKKIKIIDFNSTRLINEKNSIQKDIGHVAMMYIYLTNGIVPESPEQAVFRNKEIKSVILRALNKEKEAQYPSAKEFMQALLGCKTKYLNY
ncbi:protein kinase [Serpentinicella sp. ANB-PHB4]|uniref:protein kinase domain-containing protein n=1 Tax=Serpentinicella sp. ANB-PHB4 TaxID=3074076 RepID=UPI00285D8E11|nr:protein kinase [Serpentinicella sp. ANB-PHB4]MDR5659249.1 protein kinase [Serpentinicella sp. ANB-PHB4]